MSIIFSRREVEEGVEDDMDEREYRRRVAV